MLLLTSLVGSYPQPEWLIDRQKLAGRFPPRTRATDLWRVAPEFLEEAQDDATILAIRDQKLPASAGFAQSEDGLVAPTQRQESRELRHVLVNSISAGGGIVCAVLSREAA